VTDIEEWSAHRKSRGMSSSVEANMIDIISPKSAQILLSANESLSVPFIYQRMIKEDFEYLQPNQKRALESNETKYPNLAIVY
jgi:hypothetical protein